MNAHSTQLSACHKHFKNLQPRTKMLYTSVLTNKIISVTQYNRHCCKSIILPVLEIVPVKTSVKTTMNKRRAYSAILIFNFHV